MTARTTCSVCHRAEATDHFWIDRELGYQLVCPACQTPAQAALCQPRPAA